MKELDRTPQSASATEDLPLVARRGKASDSERRRLDMLLGASPLERWLYDLGRHYDRMPTSCRDDHALLERVVGRATQARSKRPVRSKRRLVVALSALASLVTLGAAAITLPRVLDPGQSHGSSICTSCPVTDSDREPASATKRGMTAGSGEPGKARQGLSAALTEEHAEPSAPKSSAPGDATGSLDTADAARAPNPIAAPSSVAERAVKAASEQFAHANSLRRSGQTRNAARAYRRLQREHPGSTEAQLSRVLLGRMLLQQGKASAARAQFESYLATSPDGSLAEEALHGQAAALRMSGTAAAERRVWNELLARYPHSIYVRAARERLRELD